MRADSQVYTLAAAAGSTGSGVEIRGGIYQFLADGSGAPTVQLQMQLPDDTWAEVSSLGGSYGVSTTTLPYAASPIYLPACWVRAAVTGGSSPSVNAWLAGIG